MLLCIESFMSGASAVRPELVDALVELLNRGDANPGAKLKHCNRKMWETRLPAPQ
jgi:hypothetical protein